MVGVACVPFAILGSCAPLFSGAVKWSGSVEHDADGHSWGQLVEGIQQPQAALWVHCDNNSPRGDISLTIAAAGPVEALSILADGKPVARGTPETLRTDGDDNLYLFLDRPDMEAAVRSMMIDAKDTIEVTVDFANGQSLVADFNTNGSAAAGGSLLPVCRGTQ